MTPTRLGIRKVACVGEAMIELSMGDGGSNANVGFAGDTLNTAIYLKRAWPWGQVSYVTALGTDAFSDRLLAYLQAEKLETNRIARIPDRVTGLYAITTDENGERSFTYWRENSAARQLFGAGSSVKLPDLDGFGLVYLSAITLAILPQDIRDQLRGYLSEFRSKGGLVAFDSNYRPALWPDRETARNEVSAFWSLTDIALPSLDDEMALFGDANEDAVVARLHKADVAFGALKRGSKGPRLLGPESVEVDFPQARNIVDTTAAGDSFNAGFMASVLQGHPIADCLRSGHDLAMQVIAQPGAIMALER